MGDYKLVDADTNEVIAELDGYPLPSKRVQITRVLLHHNRHNKELLDKIGSNMQIRFSRRGESVIEGRVVWADSDKFYIDIEETL